MSSVEIINNDDIRKELDGLSLDEMYERISSSVNFEDLERHLGGSGSSTEVPVENGAEDGIESVELDPITGRGSFEHYEEREFYVFAFERDSLKVYMQEGVPELIPREELIGKSVDGVFTVADNGHQAMMSDFEYRSNWRNKNRNEVEAIYDAADKVYSAITADTTEVEDEGYDIDVSRVQSELQDKLNSEYGDDYRVTLEKIARIPENANSGNSTRASWGVNDVDRIRGSVDRENNRVVIEEIANHNKSIGNSTNVSYSSDS